MITAGIDCGSKNTKTIILEDGKIKGKAKVATGFDQRKAIRNSFEAALKNALISADLVEKICGTGAGKGAVKSEFANAKELVNDIKAMGKGGVFFFPGGRTVVDVGAEEGGAVKVDKNGNVLDFAINEKCAAGAGAFIEAMAHALDIEVEQMGPLALESTTDIPMNAQCAIFAESEVVGLIHAKKEKRDISKAIHDAMASRIVAIIRRIGVNEDVVMMGGVASNVGFIEAVRRELNLKKLWIPEFPEYGMAAGAALVASRREGEKTREYSE